MTLNFLYARSGQVRNRIFNVNKLFLKRFVNVITKQREFFMTLSFLYARSGQVRNKIFHLNEQLFLKRFVNVITK